MRCQGITKMGLQCKKMGMAVEDGIFCSKHQPDKLILKSRAYRYEDNTHIYNGNTRKDFIEQYCKNENYPQQDHIFCPNPIYESIACKPLKSAYTPFMS